MDAYGNWEDEDMVYPENFDVETVICEGCGREDPIEAYTEVVLNARSYYYCDGCLDDLQRCHECKAAIPQSAEETGPDGEIYCQECADAVWSLHEEEED